MTDETVFVFALVAEACVANNRKRFDFVARPVGLALILPFFSA